MRGNIPRESHEIWGRDYLKFETTLNINLNQQEGGHQSHLLPFTQTSSLQLFHKTGELL